MASAPGSQVCSLCLSVYTGEVIQRCGHNDCRGCTDQVLDPQESELHSCPECNKEPPNQEVAIPCSYCLHTSAPAVKTCLHCEASLCHDHLKVHVQSPEHVLCEPTTVLEDHKCPEHKKILEYYCSEDDTCICVYCLAEAHRTHHLESLTKATERRKDRMKGILEKMEAKREKVDEKIEKLQKQKDEIPDTVTSLTDKVTAIFTEIRRQLEDLERKVMSEVSREKEQMSSSISELIQQLVIQKDELSREIYHIENLLSSLDPLFVLRRGVVKFCEERNDAKEIDRDLNGPRNLNRFLIALTLYDGLGNIVTKAKEDFYMVKFSEILLDKNTAANNVAITLDLKSASWSVMSQRRKESPMRFQQYQVFSIQGLWSGQHYWEVEASESEYWMVGMTYPSTETKGDQSWIGNNRKSWCLCRWHEEYSVRHNSKDLQLYSAMSSNRYGIHVDYDSGLMSFYELRDPIRHLYTFYENFTEPLHAALWVNDNGWITIRKS